MWGSGRRAVGGGAARSIHWVSGRSLIFLERLVSPCTNARGVNSYVERNDASLRNFANTHLSALGVGLLTSTAVALSSNVADLPVAGADAARLAFRLGIHVRGVSEILEPRDLSERPASWAYVVHNVDPAVAEQELDAYNSRQEAPETGKIFVSAVSRTSITVSGPPATLLPLFDKSEYFRATKSIALPVFGGLCHASHIYGPRDTDKVVHGGSTPLHMIRTDSRPVMPIYSTSTGQQYSVVNAADVYECVVSELLTNAILWDSVIDGLVAEAKCNAISRATVYCFGNSLPLNDLYAALKNGVPNASSVIEDLTAWLSQPAPSDSSPRGPAQAKLAIVGMSCRLPGDATTTEKFWDILEQGRDVSSRIPADRFDIDSQ